jgi:hypothetical protein
MEFIILLAVFSFFLFFVLGLFFRMRKERQQRKNHEELITHTVKERFQSFMKVGGFLQHSKFINPIASWRGEKIYQYILNEGFLYEFSDILPEDESKIEINEKTLTFNQMLYLRTNDHDSFLTHFSNELTDDETTTLKDFDHNEVKDNHAFNHKIETINKIKDKKEKESLAFKNNENNNINLPNSSSQSLAKNVNVTGSINAYMKKSSPMNSNSILLSKEEGQDFIPDSVEPVVGKKESKFKSFLSHTFFKIKDKLKKKS